MKYLFSIIILFCSLGINARDYLPILKEGRVWNCIYSPTLTYPYPKPIQIYVAEEVIENGHTCRVLRWKNMNGDGIFGTAYEEKGKLYALNVNGIYPELLMLDFNLEKGDVVSDFLCVSNVDYVNINGVVRKRIFFSNESTYWIEGIGPTYDNLWISPIDHVIGLFMYLESCYDDDVCVFKNDDPPFWSDWTEGVETVKSDTKSTGNKTFDTSGRIINDKDYKGIVIKDGKKFCK